MSFAVEDARNGPSLPFASPSENDPTEFIIQSDGPDLDNDSGEDSSKDSEDDSEDDNESSSDDGNSVASDYYGDDEGIGGRSGHAGSVEQRPKRPTPMDLAWRQVAIDEAAGRLPLPLLPRLKWRRKWSAAPKRIAGTWPQPDG